MHDASVPQQRSLLAAGGSRLQPDMVAGEKSSYRRRLRFRSRLGFCCLLALAVLVVAAVLVLSSLPLSAFLSLSPRPSSSTRRAPSPALQAPTVPFVGILGSASSLSSSPPLVVPHEQYCHDVDGRAESAAANSVSSSSLLQYSERCCKS